MTEAAEQCRETTAVDMAGLRDHTGHFQQELESKAWKGHRRDIGLGSPAQWVEQK